MSNCSTCKNAIFDAFWGEYKCKEYLHTVFAGRGKDAPCPKYAQGTPEGSKVNERYPNKED